MTARQQIGARPSSLAESEPLAFEPLLIPLVESAREELDRRTSALSEGHLSPEAWDGVSRELASLLATVSAPLLFDDFARHRATCTSDTSDLEPGSTRVFEEYVGEALGDGLARLRREFPVWAELTALLADRWIESSAELLERLDADRKALEATFGAVGDLGHVAEVQPGLSDRHDGGRTVHGIRFSSGTRIVYKPRDLGPEASFYALLSWLNGREGGTDLRVPAMLTRSGYGWMERLASSECETGEEVRDFHRRAGSLLAVLQLLGATDCHAGNLIAGGPHPVLIDLETIVQHDLDSDEDAALLLTGILTLRKHGLDGKRYDVGALTGSVGLERDLAVWRFDAIDTDGMEMTVEYRARPSTENRLLRDGQMIHAGSYVEEVVSGFSSTYRTMARERPQLAAPDGPLSAFGRLRVRHLMRPTLSYAECIYRSVAPGLLRDAESRSAELERLLDEGAARPHASDPGALRSIKQAEIAALSDLDVPRFTARADARDIEALSGRVAADYFRDTGFRGVQRRLEGMSEERLEAAIGLIRAALGVASFSAFLPDS